MRRAKAEWTLDQAADEGSSDRISLPQHLAETQSPPNEPGIRGVSVKRIRQLLSHETRDLLWLGYVMGIAPWAHRAAGPMHKLQRWLVYRRRQLDLDRSMELLRARVVRRSPAQVNFCLALAELCPALDAICHPLRRPDEEIIL